MLISVNVFKQFWVLINVIIANEFHKLNSTSHWLNGDPKKEPECKKRMNGEDFETRFFEEERQGEFNTGKFCMF